jgi:hypothetical protein
MIILCTDGLTTADRSSVLTPRAEEGKAMEGAGEGEGDSDATSATFLKMDDPFTAARMAPRHFHLLMAVFAAYCSMALTSWDR